MRWCNFSGFTSRMETLPSVAIPPENRKEVLLRERRHHTSMFCKKRNRIAFVKKTQFSLRVLGSSWIHEDSTLEQVAMEIRN